MGVVGVVVVFFRSSGLVIIFFVELVEWLEDKSSGVEEDGE